MRYEPPIDRARLVESVRHAYGLAVEGLALTRVLHERGLLPRVAHPIPTRRGDLRATFSGSRIAVFPFLTGHAPAEWTPALHDEWARTFAALHRATPALADVLPPRETFEIPFEADLRRGLAAIERVGPGEQPGLRALRGLVLPRRGEVLAQLERLHGLRGAVRRLPGPFVLCHTDMGGDNLLVDEQGRLWVLDWDDATVAPPEYDLAEARGEGFGRFLEAYAEAGGARALHLDHFAFYLLRRYLGDMAVRMLSILGGNATGEEDEDALEGMVAWGFAQWCALDETLSAIAAALRRHD